MVDFDVGDVLDSEAVFTYRVRCVRGSRCYPKSRLLVRDGELVSNTVTGLAWQQQVSSTPLRWDDAQNYCSNAGAGFRVPTLKELESLIDLTVTLPSIDQKAFPSTPADWFWTSSPFGGWSSIWAWNVSSSDGYSNDHAVMLDFYRVRCVR